MIETPTVQEQYRQAPSTAGVRGGPPVDFDLVRRQVIQMPAGASLGWYVSDHMSLDNEFVRHWTQDLAWPDAIDHGEQQYEWFVNIARRHRQTRRGHR